MSSHWCLFSHVDKSNIPTCVVCVLAASSFVVFFLGSCYYVWPICSHYQLVTYRCLVKNPWCRVLLHWAIFSVFLAWMVKLAIINIVKLKYQVPLSLLLAGCENMSWQINAGCLKPLKAKQVTRLS